LGRRLVAFYAPELLSAEESGHYQAWLRSRWSAADTPETEWMTVEKSRRALAEVQASGACAAELVVEIDAFLQAFDVAQT
jgi:exodeoxyribonuclease-1